MIDRVRHSARFGRDFGLRLADVVGRAAVRRSARGSVAHADGLRREMPDLANRRIGDVEAAERGVAAVAELRAGLAGRYGDRRAAVVLDRAGEADTARVTFEAEGPRRAGRRRRRPAVGVLGGGRARRAKLVR